MILYLLTISCQQKLNYVSKQNLDEVILWLKMNHISFKVYKHSYERSGKYSQLHFHGIVQMAGRWLPFTQYGDSAVMDNTFRLQWSRVTDYPGALDYVLKDTKGIASEQDEIIILNYYQYHFFNQTTQEFQLPCGSS